MVTDDEINVVPVRGLAVAATSAPIMATGGSRVIPEYAFETMPSAHILVVRPADCVEAAGR